MPIPDFLRNKIKQEVSTVLASSATMLGGGAPKAHQLKYSNQTQIETNWCWAAVGASVSGYYDNNTKWSQCSIANAALSRGDCCVNSSYCNQPWRLDVALKKTGNFRKILSNKLNFESLVGELDANHPVCCLINWDGGGSGHFVAITGYSVGSNGDEYVYVSDPIYQETRMAFDDFADQYQQGASWNYTFLTQSAMLGGAVAFVETDLPHDDLLGGGYDEHLC